MPDFRVRQLITEELPMAMERLSDILIDAVASGAGVSFMHPLSKRDANDYWAGLASGMAKGQTAVLIAERDETILGTVQLHRVWPPNQPHRGEIAKLLVHSDFRRRGIATALMEAAEAKARESKLTLLTFDTVAGSSAERFYLSQGYTRAGYYPGYAYSPTGKLDDTALFYKRL